MTVCRCDTQLSGYKSLDKFDKAIINELRHNARQSISFIAEQVNLSRSAVTERIKKLEQTGVIRGYQVLLSESQNKACRHTLKFSIVAPVAPKSSIFSPPYRK